MKEIKDAQKKWRAAKQQAQASCETAHQYDMARKLGACQMFTGEESMEEMIRLMFSPQGAEFLTTFGFPDLDTFRKFTKYQPERLGVFIDKGEISLSQEKNIFVVGNTTARIKCSETALYRIILMHGASADIEASGYAVLKVEKDGVSSYNINKTEFVKVL